MKPSTPFSSQLQSLSPEELHHSLLQCGGSLREQHVACIQHLIVLIPRRDFLSRGYPSLIPYLEKELRISTGLAYRLWNTAELALREPSTLTLLQSGELSLEAASELFRALRERGVPRHASAARPFKKERPSSHAKMPPLSPQEQHSLFQQIQNKPLKHVERILAEVRPEPKKPKRTLTRLPGKRVRIVLEFSDSEFQEISNAQKTLSSSVPSMKLEHLFLYLVRKKQQNQTKSSSPKPKTSTPPKSITPKIRKKLLAQSKHQCQFVSPQGLRCSATTHLDIDHILPKSKGGSNHIQNLRVLCAAHNRSAPDFKAKMRSGRLHAQDPPF